MEGSDTFKAACEGRVQHYVKVQSEAAVRHLATSCPYDHMEDETATITLRDGGEEVNHMLETELNERLAPAGIIVKESRIAHLAYAAEIAGAMLQRQQATAIVAARSKIVEGAVGYGWNGTRASFEKGYVLSMKKRKQRW